MRRSRSSSASGSPTCTLVAQVESDGLPDEILRDTAERAKATCPLSKALAGVEIALELPDLPPEDDEEEAAEVADDELAAGRRRDLSSQAPRPPGRRSPQPLRLTAMSPFEKTVEELERSYTEAQERMSDPAVYNDHREAAEVGRGVKELEGPYKLAQAWRQARADLEAARSDAELAEMVAGLRGRGGAARGGAEARRSSSATRPTTRT